MCATRAPTASASSCRIATSPPVLRIAPRPALLASGAGPQPQQGEPVAHRRDHGVRRIPCRGDGGDDHDAAGPGQRLAAIGADVAFPAAVIDFADRGQHAGAGVAVGGQDQVKSLITSVPWSPILRSRPPVDCLDAAACAARPRAVRLRWRWCW